MVCDFVVVVVGCIFCWGRGVDGGGGMTLSWKLIHYMLGGAGIAQWLEHRTRD